MSARADTLSSMAANPAPDSLPRKRTYGQILKSSALVGGSSIINLGIGIVRSKAMALLIGPAGIGLLGIYQSILDMSRTIAGMGISSSGVRQIADAAGSGNHEKIARTVTTLRRVALLLGLAGGLLLVCFCQPIARLSFRGTANTGWVALLGVGVVFMAVSSGQIAVLQGMRRIADLARANVLGSLLGTVCSLGVIYLFVRFGDKYHGVAPALVCVTAMSAAASWWFSRQVRVERVRLRLADLSAEISGLLKLGFVFMSTTLMSAAAAYIVRMIVNRRLGPDAAGYYQSAWVLGGYYVGFILQAMGADFFPRLTAAAKDNSECNRLVNEQAEVSLLLAGPGMLGTLTFAPMVILLFYTRDFAPAADILRWICLGMVLRVASWPMSFILLAKDARQPYFWTELLTTLAQVGFVWLGLSRFGITGTGIAFFASYLVYWLTVYLVVRKVSVFRWSRENKQIGLIYGGLVSLLFVAWYWLPHQAVMAGGGVMTVGAGFFSLKKLCHLVPIERFPAAARPILRWVERI